jgi:hypothetical protein
LPDTRLDLRRRLLLAGSAPLGFAFVLCVVLARYASARALGKFFYWFYDYNVEVYMQPYQATPFRSEFDGFFAREHWILLAVALALVASIAGRLGAIGRARFADALVCSR